MILIPGNIVGCGNSGGAGREREEGREKEGATGIQRVEDRDPDKYPATHKPFSHSKEVSVQNVASVHTSHLPRVQSKRVGWRGFLKGKKEEIASTTKKP